VSEPRPASGPERGEREAARGRQSHVRHELRAPLAVMYPLLSLLRDETAGPLTATQREYLEMMERNVARVHALVVSCAESGWLDCAAAPLEPAAVLLREVAEEVVSRLKAEDGAQDLRVVADGPDALAWADREHVRCIVRNLVDNAVRYAPARAVTVEVRGGADRAVAILAVRDEGPGLGAEDVRQAFDFGFRGAAAREAGVPGLGAGLWTCRRLAELNGGIIELDSATGDGTTVTVTLPSTPG
jgi:signal transduction histidine kinase